jgi:hypothetical protein
MSLICLLSGGILEQGRLTRIRVTVCFSVQGHYRDAVTGADFKDTSQNVMAGAANHSTSRFPGRQSGSGSNNGTGTRDALSTGSMSHRPSSAHCLNIWPRMCGAVKSVILPCLLGLFDAGMEEVRETRRDEITFLC